MYSRLWKSLAIPTILVSTTLAVPTPQLPSVPSHRDPTNARLENGVVAFIRPYPADGWQLDYDDIGDKIKEALGVETNSKVVNNVADQPSSSPAQGHGTGTGRLYTYPASEGSEYLASVYVGGQVLQINPDTGSSDLWVFSTALENHERGQHTLYDPKRSESHQKVPFASFKVAYGDETSMTGEVAADTVSLGGIAVSSQAISLPTSFSDGIIDDPSDGILGLGFQNLNSICSKSQVQTESIRGSTDNLKCPSGHTPNPRPTWFENAKSALKGGLFAVNFKFGTNGYYDFGTFDRNDFRGDLTYIPINSKKGYWQFPSRMFRVGGKGDIVTFNGADGIADSGTSVLKLDPAVVEAYYAQVKGAEESTSGWTFPCNAVLPDLDIALGNFLATIEGKVVNYAPTKTAGGKWMIQIPARGLLLIDPIVCYGGIQSTDGQGPQIFGDIFFKSNFVVFDYDGMRLGVAQHA